MFKKALVLLFASIAFVSQFSPSRPETTIILTGDIMLGRSVSTTSLKKNNPNYPFEKVAETLKTADIVFANLENPIVASCQSTDSGMIFCAKPEMLVGLKNAHVDIVSLANNHTKNYGENGLSETKNYLTKAGIDYAGVDSLIIKRVNGTNFGFLSFDFLDKNPVDSDYQLIRDSKKKVDILIVMVHWGIEYSSQPTQNQKTIAKELVRAGADVIVGTHPHTIQGVENIEGKLVFYSLGNFIFDQPWSEETKKGLAIRLTYQGSDLIKIDKLPIYMKSLAQPEW